MHISINKEITYQVLFADFKTEIRQKKTYTKISISTHIEKIGYDIIINKIDGVNDMKFNEFYLAALAHESSILCASSIITTAPSNLISIVCRIKGSTK